MVETPSTHSLGARGQSVPVGALPALPPEESSLSQADRIAAERLIRTTVQVLSGGAPVRNLDELIARNMSSLTHAEIAAGRLGTKVLGDIIGTIEQAKGNASFNWNAASREQIDEYMRQKGINPATLGHGMGVNRMADGGGGNGGSGGGNGTANPASASANGVSPATMANYERDYAGMGFDPGTIGTFAAVGLRANDERALEQRFGRDEVVKGANTADDFGLKGKQGVKAAAGMSDNEHDLWLQWGQEKDPVKKQEIRNRIQALPTHSGKTEPETKDDRRYIEKHLNPNSRAFRQKFGASAQQAVGNPQLANAEESRALADGRIKEHKKDAGDFDALAALEEPPAGSSDKSATAAKAPDPKQQKAEASKTGDQPKKPQADAPTRLGLATQARQGPR